MDVITERKNQQSNIRDYFAGQIIGALMTGPDRSLQDAEYCVGEVFNLADRMLKESMRYNKRKEYH